MIKILQGDCLERLKDLPDASVQMCVTSPPYYGLRDYGTGTWEGGSDECDHKETALYGSASTLRNDGRAHKGPYEGEKGATFSVTPYKDACAKCGATRVDQQIGLEYSVDFYVAKLVAVFREVRRVLKDDGVVFLNLGDSYNGAGPNRASSKRHSGTMTAEGNRTWPGLKTKDLIGIPWRVAFALQADGWYLRQDIIWHKPNAMPESVKDRCTKAHEYLFLLSKRATYYYNGEAIKEVAVSDKVRDGFRGGDGTRYTNGRSFNNSAEHIKGGGSKEGEHRRNCRSVWTVATTPYAGSHFATFPVKLIEPCILAGSRPEDVILDPFGGAGTTALVSRAHSRQSVLIELNESYIEITKNRLGLLEEVA